MARLVFRLPGGREYRECHNILIVGANGPGHQTSQQLQAYSGPQLKIVGYVDDDPGEAHQDDHPILGALDKICRVVKEHTIDEVIIALPYRSYSRLDQY